MVGGIPRPSLVDRSEACSTHRPNTAVVLEGEMRQIRGRSYESLVHVELEDDPRGVPFANGSRLGVHAMYVTEQTLVSIDGVIGLEARTLAPGAARPEQARDPGARPSPRPIRGRIRA
jgi:hypothetical protein